MTDALAADRLLGESPAEMFAFGSHSMRKESDRAEEWEGEERNAYPVSQVQTSLVSAQDTACMGGHSP